MSGRRAVSQRSAKVAAVALAVLASGCGAAVPRASSSPSAAARSPNPSPPASPSPAARLSPTPAQPCGVGGPGPATVEHVVLIVMENRAYSEVIGSADAPYINQLASLCGLATGYQAVAHPSLPNYLALTSGSTQGVTDDGGPDQHPLSAPSIFSLLGSNWRSLEESMPTNCDLQSGGEYAVKHNPAAYFTSVRHACQGQDVPLSTPPDLSAAFTFITPNLCHDMHDCSTSAGDSWLAQEVPRLLSTPQYLSGQTVIFITWDESTGSTQQVPLLVIAPTVPRGARVAGAFSHYSLLRTAEQLLGLSPLLGAAASAPSMVSAFNL
jgi:phospholipase C